MVMSDLELDRAKAQAQVDEVLSYTTLSKKAKQRGISKPTMLDVVEVLLSSCQPGCTQPDSLGAHGQCGDDLAAGGDAAGRQHRHLSRELDDLGNERQGADDAGVSARVVPLGDQDVGPGRQGRLCVAWRSDQSEGFLAGVLGTGHDLGRHADAAGEEVDVRRQNRFDLLLGYLLGADEARAHARS